MEERKKQVQKYLVENCFIRFVPKEVGKIIYDYWLGSVEQYRGIIKTDLSIEKYYSYLSCKYPGSTALSASLSSSIPLSFTNFLKSSTSEKMHHINYEHKCEFTCEPFYDDEHDRLLLDKGLESLPKIEDIVKFNFETTSGAIIECAGYDCYICSPNIKSVRGRDLGYREELELKIMKWFILLSVRRQEFSHLYPIISAIELDHFYINSCFTAVHVEEGQVTKQEKLLKTFGDVFQLLGEEVVVNDQKMFIIPSLAKEENKESKGENCFKYVRIDSWKINESTDDNEYKIQFFIKKCQIDFNC